MTAYLLLAGVITVSLLMVMHAHYEEVHITPAGLTWLVLLGLVPPLGLVVLTVLIVGPPDDDS